jgi:plastocyanin
MIRKVDITYLTTFALFMTAVVTFYSCGSSTPNTTAATVSSANAKIVTCPGTTAADVSITTTPAFQPGSVSIAVNDVVKWTNNDSAVHTATSGTPGALDGKFDTGNLAPNAVMCVQFLAAGSYNYFCNIHTFMTGTVTVQ